MDEFCSYILTKLMVCFNDVIMQSNRTNMLPANLPLHSPNQSSTPANSGNTTDVLLGCHAKHQVLLAPKHKARQSSG